MAKPKINASQIGNCTNTTGRQIISMAVAIPAHTTTFDKRVEFVFTINPFVAT